MGSAGSKEHLNTPSINTKATYYFLNINRLNIATVAVAECTPSFFPEAPYYDY